MPTPEHDRRGRPRIKVSVPVELCIEGSEFPIRGATSDISLSGCYMETIFPVAVGTTLELKLQVDGTLLFLAKVVTCDPQVGKRDAVHQNAFRGCRGTTGIPGSAEDGVNLG